MGERAWTVLKVLCGCLPSSMESPWPEKGVVPHPPLQNELLPSAHQLWGQSRDGHCSLSFIVVWSSPFWGNHCFQLCTYTMNLKTLLLYSTINLSFRAGGKIIILLDCILQRTACAKALEESYQHGMVRLLLEMTFFGEIITRKRGGTRIPALQPLSRWLLEEVGGKKCLLLPRLVIFLRRTQPVNPS